MWEINQYVSKYCPHRQEELKDVEIVVKQANYDDYNTKDLHHEMIQYGDQLSQFHFDYEDVDASTTTILGILGEIKRLTVEINRREKDGHS